MTTTLKTGAQRSPDVAEVTAREILAVRELLARQPALDELHRQAFLGRFTDVRCAEVGATTRALDVLRGALSLAHVLERAMEVDALPYAPSRLAWLLECTLSLHEARQSSLAKHDGEGRRIQPVDIARAAANEAREALLVRLTAIAGDEEAAELRRAAGKATPDRELVRSLRRLAKLSSTWFERARGWGAASILVASVKLQPALVAEAVAAASELERSAKAGVEPARKKDPPRVDRAEGRLLFEMLAAKRALESARLREARLDAWEPSAALTDALERLGGAARAPRERSPRPRR